MREVRLLVLSSVLHLVAMASAANTTTSERGSTVVGAGAPRENRRSVRYTCSLSIKPGGRNALLPAGRGKKKKHTEQIFLETRRGHVSTHGKSREAVARAIGIGQSRSANRVSVHLAMGRLSNKLSAGFLIWPWPLGHQSTVRVPARR